MKKISQKNSLVIDGIHQTIAEGNTVIPLESEADIKRL